MKRSRSLPVRGAAFGSPREQGHGKHSQQHTSVIPPVEREDVVPQVIAIGQATVGPAASEFTVQLVRAMVAEQLDVSVLITTEDASADAQSVLSALVDAGAHDSTWLRVPHDAPKPALERALGRFSKDQWVIVLGNVLPIFYRPLFCALVSAPRSTDIPEARRIAPHADLQVSSPSEKLAVEIAKLIRAKALVRSGSTG